MRKPDSNVRSATAGPFKLPIRANILQEGREKGGREADREALLP